MLIKKGNEMIKYERSPIKYGKERKLVREAKATENIMAREDGKPTDLPLGKIQSIKSPRKDEEKEVR